MKKIKSHSVRYAENIGISTLTFVVENDEASSLPFTTIVSLSISKTELLEKNKADISFRSLGKKNDVVETKIIFTEDNEYTNYDVAAFLDNIREKLNE